MYPKLLHVTYKLEQNRLFVAIRSGLLFLIPILIVGSIALAVKNFPIPAFTGFLEYAAGGVFMNILDLIYDATFGLMSLYLSCSISYFYALNYHDSSEEFRLVALIASLGCFLISFGAPLGGFEFADFGALGIATAIICSLLSTSLLYFFCKKMPQRFRSYAAGADQQFRNVTAMIFPLALTLIVFAAMNQLIQLTGAQNLNYFFSGIVNKLFQSLNGEVAKGAVFVLFLDGLWFFGMHGGNIMEQVARMFFQTGNLDPGVIVSKSFLDHFVLMGGSGATLCLLLALLLFSKNTSSRKLAWSAAPFAVLNINELLLFGFPVILNPMLLIPFLLTPLLTLGIAYFATAIGFLPVVNKTIIWSTPILISGYATVESVRGVIVQIISLAAGTALYAPFIRLFEYLQDGHERRRIEELTEVFWKEYNDPYTSDYLGRSDQIGVISKALAAQLRADIRSKDIPIHFQPQFNAAGEIVGAETLLRWQYHGYAVAPPIVCKLAQEDQLFDELTQVIIEDAAANMLHIQGSVGPDFSYSVNVTARQIDDQHFIDRVIALVTRLKSGVRLCLELVEDEALERYDNIEANLARLNQSGIYAAIDDFSMGKTSIKYLQNNHFRYIKLDGDLVRQLPNNPRSQDIVRSITSLGNDLGFEVIAEYVETAALRDLLLAIGCHTFQGYFYSPAVPPDELFKMLKGDNRLS